MASENADGLPTREQLAERVRELEAHVNTDRAPVSRRGALAALLGAGGLAAASQPGAAQFDDRGTACTWLGDQNAAGYDLFALSHNFMGTVSDTPGDDEYASGEVAVYVKNDDNLYIRPNGGSEQQVSGTNGSGPWSDLGSDTDGGNDYGLPNAADNIDLQGDGRVANADLISTDDAVVKNAPTSDNDVLRHQEGVEVNTATASASDRSGSDGTWDTKSAALASVSYSTAFKSSPTVVMSPDNGADSLDAYNVEPTNVSTTGHTFKFKEWHSQNLSSETMAANSIATEGR